MPKEFTLHRSYVGNNNIIYYNLYPDYKEFFKIKYDFFTKIMFSTLTPDRN